MKYPKSLILNKSNTNINLIIKGQGVFIFETTDTSPCTFTFFNKDKTEGIIVVFSTDNLKVNRIGLLEPLNDPNNKTGLTSISGAYYWFSLDSQNQTLYAGIGETRLDTVIYKYQFTYKDNDERKANKKFLESLVNIIVDSSTISPLKLLRDPITLTMPLIVKNTESLSINHIAEGKYLPKSNLSMMGQKLYDCISGKNFVLDDNDFPDFSKAIEYSIATKDMWCYKKLKEKSTEFNKDKPNYNETYLRITLGQNNGESPGIPYVLEIWPVQHFSPIHNHGTANAIIKVLHGSINVKLFPYLSGNTEAVKPFAVKNFHKNDITWISPTLNQVHQLTNIGNKHTCITIQCYMYEQENTTHYDYFDYVDDNGEIKQYEPDSDMDFVEFKKRMKEEWNSRPQNKSILSRCLSCFKN
jgi:hypothetical protein